jgi:hypothetical protein
MSRLFEKVEAGRIWANIFLERLEGRNSMHFGYRWHGVLFLRCDAEVFPKASFSLVISQ